MKETKILAASEPAAVSEGAKILRKGGLVAFPTETVYGLGADACNPAAVARIFEAKQRPAFDPLIVHVAGLEEAILYAEFCPAADALARKFWPGPLTIVLPKREIVPPIVTAGLETVAIRCPAHPAALALIRAAGRAVAAPSANPFGYVSPTEALHVSSQLSGKIDLILDGGPCLVGVESTIISLTGPKPCLLRSGGITLEELEKDLGSLERLETAVDPPLAPGQLSRHYATCTRLDIQDEGPNGNLELNAGGARIGLITLTPPRNPERFAAIEVLSQSGNLREAAANLFAALRRLDNLGLDRLVAFPVPEKGLGLAIMDRLRRSSTQENPRTISRQG